MLAIQVSPSLTGNNTDTNEFGIRARVSGICDKFVVVALLKALDFATPPPNSLIRPMQSESCPFASRAVEKNEQKNKIKKVHETNITKNANLWIRTRVFLIRSSHNLQIGHGIVSGNPTHPAPMPDSST
jgi:hypothetical protein